MAAAVVQTEELEYIEFELMDRLRVNRFDVRKVWRAPWVRICERTSTRYMEY